MLVFIVRRSLRAVLVLLVMSVLVFIGVYVVGNPMDILVNPQADPLQRQHAISALGLEEPIWMQYRVFLSAALRGDLGESFVHNMPALGLVLERLPATLELCVAALLIALALAVPLGLLAGLKPDTAVGRFVNAGSILGVSLPTFWVGVMLVMVFSVMLGWLPAKGRGPTTLLFGVGVSFLSHDGWRYLLLPAISLASFELALFTRLIRAGTLAALRQDYVKFARAKGLPNRRVVGVHVLRNAILPLGCRIGLETGSVIALAIVTESVFAWPGVGKLLIDSIHQLDRPTIVAYLLVTVLLFTGINLVFDIFFAALDPRVRLSEAQG